MAEQRYPPERWRAECAASLRRSRERRQLERDGRAASLVAAAVALALAFALFTALLVAAPWP